MKSGYHPTAMQRLLVGALCLAAISGCTVESVGPGKNAMREWYAGFLSQYRTASLTLAQPAAGAATTQSSN